MTDTQATPLDPQTMNPDPIRQFQRWFEEARQAQLPMFEAMTLATSNASGKPSARIVLLRGVDERGFLFYTNYEGLKAHQIKENPYVALVFYWQPLARQVRIEGRVEKLSPEESDSYFAGRPRGHQLGAHASPQSRVIPDRARLEKRFAEVTERYAGQDVPRPEHWGGYLVIPETIEFWQEGQDRLHDRLRYRRSAQAGWTIERLAP